MDKGLMPLRYAARKYKLPPDWLEQEAKSGRLSCLIAGDVILFNERRLLRELQNKVGRQLSRSEGATRGAAR
jgi:hypothetical protein